MSDVIVVACEVIEVAHAGIGRLLDQLALGLLFDAVADIEAAKAQEGSAVGERLSAESKALEEVVERLNTLAGAGSGE